jgi:protein SCO1/2
MRLPTALLPLVIAHAASAGPLALPPQPHVEFRQNIGARVPLDALLRDEDDRGVRLSKYFGTAPVVLVLGYYRCPNLCTTEMQSVLQTLGALPLAKDNYGVVAVSIDPRETATDARHGKAAYASIDAGWSTRLHMLSGDGATVARIAHAAGFQYAYDRNTDQYVHPAGFLVASPDGRISRYFLGVTHSARDLRLALVEASQGRLGSPVDRVVLLCSHYDPATGRYSVAVMNAVRAVSLGVLMLLGAWLWRRHRSGGRA